MNVLLEGASVGAVRPRGRPHANATAAAVMLLCGPRNEWE